MTADDVVIRQKTSHHHPRGQSAYMTLLSSLATDLDLMLNDLRSTPPRFIQPRTTVSLLAQLGPDSSQLRSNKRHTSCDPDDGGNNCDDDLQTLLPLNRPLSRDELSQSRGSLVSSSDGGILAEGETSSESSGGSTSPPCDLGLVERLLRTHPVWFLPGIQRAGAVHLLQGKEEGNFVVRGSSQPNTMAVSVRLPPDTGPYIEHYLIQSNDSLLSLESSRFKFDSIPALIAHYAQCCDELPVQLILPRALREAKNRQQLSSLALLGQEFWRYPMASPKPNQTTIPIELHSGKLKTNETFGIATTIFNSTFSQQQQQQQQQSHHVTTATNILSPTQLGQNQQQQIGGTNFAGSSALNQVETPSDTTSSLSSFTSTGQQLLSPESIDSVVLTMSPVESCRSGIVGKMSTFKAQTKRSGHQICNLDVVETKQQQTFSPSPSSSNISSFGQQIGTIDGSIRAPRPTPPSTLNLGSLRIPPAPPPRWSKPPTPISPGSTVQDTQSTNNFTVTTTVTFSVEGNQKNSQIVEVTSPTANTTFQTISKRLSPEGECKTHEDTLSSQGSKRWQSQSSKDSIPNSRKLISPSLVETPTGRVRRSKIKKESKHYQESDILESPSVYCRSALGDKISDYEDLWTQDNNIPFGRGGQQLSSFRPDGSHGKRPDLLPETPTITSLNGNLLSPTGSLASSNNSPPLISKKPTISAPISEFAQFNAPTSMQTTPITVQQQIIAIENNNNNNKSYTTYTTSTTTEQTMVYQKNLQSFSSPIEIYPPNPMLQPRNRLGLILQNTGGESNLAENDATTPIQTPQSGRTKQDSPFYAEPADALSNIMRRNQTQRSIQLPSNQRFSEPPKGPIRVTPCPSIVPPTEQSDKNIIAGSLDELKKKLQKSKGRHDPWPLDSSWEFMGNEEQDDNDYDSDLHWKSNKQQRVETNKPILPPKPEGLKPNLDFIAKRPLTIHQIIAKKLPELNLPELIRCSTSSHESSPGMNGTLVKGQRVSAYDNVERGHSGYATSLLACQDSAQSDDGTVFSEPWDSSQWDSFLPHDDTSDTIHLSKCRPALSQSEDDTLIEDVSHKELLGKTSFQIQKVATIDRNRNFRDREILCHPRNKSTAGGPGETVGAYALSLANDHTSTFSQNIENFISCTKESRETSPIIVMRNMRQFMNGMKNYLVKHGEKDFQREVRKASELLKPDEFLNLDLILETVMHRLVILPLREHLYSLFVDFYTRSGDIQLLVENVNYANFKTAADIGIRPEVIPPNDVAMRHISLILQHLQECEQPLEKLDWLMMAIKTISETTGCPKGYSLNADDFLPLLVYVVAKTGFVGAEIEAEFIWGLVHQSFLTGEPGYYLTALSSAVHVLKTFKDSQNEGTGTIDWRSSSMPACSSVLRVIIPDECNGSLQTRTLPVRPHTTTKEVCRIIAHKARITNPQDYGLFKLVDGEETLLIETECPQDARFAARGKHCMLAYKRIDAKIAWPTTPSINQYHQ